MNRSSVARWRHYQDYIAPLLALSRTVEAPADGS
jgi:hypothetical protein